MTNFQYTTIMLTEPESSVLPTPNLLFSMILGNFCQCPIEVLYHQCHDHSHMASHHGFFPFTTELGDLYESRSPLLGNVLNFSLYSL